MTVVLLSTDRLQNRIDRVVNLPDSFLGTDPLVLNLPGTKESSEASSIERNDVKASSVVLDAHET